MEGAFSFRFFREKLELRKRNYFNILDRCTAINYSRIFTVEVLFDAAFRPFVTVGSDTEKKQNVTAAPEIVF